MGANANIRLRQIVADHPEPFDLPWALLAATYLVGSGRLKVLLLPITALFWLLLSLSQLGLTLWAFLFVLALLLAIHPRQSWLPLLSAGLGVGAAIILYGSISPGLTAPPLSFTDHFLYPFQLFSAYWGYGPSRSVN